MFGEIFLYLYLAGALGTGGTAAYDWCYDKPEYVKVNQLECHGSAAATGLFWPVTAIPFFGMRAMH